MQQMHYLVPETYESLEPLRDSALASIRMRLVPAALALMAKGWRCSFGDTVSGAPSRVVVTKIGANGIEARQPLWLEQLSQSKRQGAAVWVDYTDHHLGFASPMSEFYCAALSFADACTVPSHHMESLLAKLWNGPIHVVEDAIEVQIAPPKPQTDSIVTLLWFGHASNVEYLRRFLETGLDVGQEIRLIALSNEAGLNLITAHPIQSLAKIEILLGLWSVETMVEAAAQADVCIIPSDVNDPRKAAAGSNRLVTALALGLPTAADALHSYAEFKDYYTALRSEEFKGLLKSPQSFHAPVVAAQQNIVPRFTASTLGERWASLLG